MLLVKIIVALFILRGIMIVFEFGPTWIPWVDDFLTLVISTVGNISRALSRNFGLNLL